MTDRPSQWAIEQAVMLVAAMMSEFHRDEQVIVDAVGYFADALDKMRAVNEVPKDLEGLGYGGVVRSHHDGD